MSENKTNRNQPQAASTDVGQAEVQQAFDEANKHGFFGVTTDPTPDENYTLAGQNGGAKTPETDAALADEVAAHQRKLARGEQ